jgi:hypothetical protein
MVLRVGTRAAQEALAGTGCLIERLVDELEEDVLWIS